MTIRPLLNALARGSAWVWHHCVWIVSACALVLAVGVLALRYWVLPNIGDYRETIEQSVSKAAGQKVTIGEITADWEGFRPRLNLAAVRVYDKAGRAALVLKRIDSTVSWLSLVLWRPRFRSIDIYEPALDVRRDKAGIISVAGIEMGGDTGEGGFSDWVLSQRDIEIHQAAIAWTDEMRGAPTLQLRDVSVRLVNRGDRHRFGVKAWPPEQLGGVLDVRGDLSGESIKNPADWKGRVYVNVDHVDIAAWRTWAPFPFEFARGEGALRAWVEIRDQTLREMITDVRLANVRARLGKTLPELDLPALGGRLTLKRSPSSLEFTAARLALTTAGNLTTPPMNLRYKVTLDAAGSVLAGDVGADAIDLTPLVSLADHLPMDETMRKRLAALSPQGKLFDVSAQWEGAFPLPKKYHARGRFEALAMNRGEVLPGLKGISGQVDANEKGGTLQLKSQAFRLDMPQVFKAPLEFDTIAGQASWQVAEKGFNLKLANMAYANADLDGILSGTYQSVPSQPGIADLTGSLKRADARRVTHYLPLAAGRNARPWLEAAFLAGSSNDVKFRLKGDLRDFPFDDEKKGTFLITAKVSGGTLHYADGWPDIENIAGDVMFRGQRMEVNAQQGTIQGVKLAGVRAEIPELDGARVLTVTGDAEGATQSFLKFIASSPVTGYIDRFTEGMQAEGPGKLKLRLELPLRNLEKTRVVGTVQMTGNRVLIEPSLPPLEQTTGSIEFTESGVNVPAATATFFGGPLSLTGSTQRDGTIRIGLKGRVDTDVVRRAGGPAWLSQLRGATDWQGAVTVRKKTVDLTLESSLQGIASALPAPFVKAAAESVPLRVERRFLGPERDQIALSYGEVFSARLNRRVDGKRSLIDRGVVRLGGGAAGEPERDGVVVSGSLKSVNFDEWLKFSGSPAGGAAGSGDIAYSLSAVDVKLGEFELYERKFGELAVSAGGISNAETVRYRLQGREIEGIADWNPQGRGRLVAQLQKLVIPSVPSAPAKPVAAPREKPTPSEAQLPALDVVAEHFQMGAKQLGKLDLKATPQVRDWRIDKLTLTHADGTLTADGVWQSWLTQPRTQVNVQWTVRDAGSTLGRLGYPGAVRAGVAEIGGTLAWDGGPHQMDYASLSGKFAFRAANGQFRQMEPGIGKLLGIISLQSLPRRLSLDFRDVFSRGFAFDEILGEIKVDNGVAATDKFLITGPAAKVLMSGSVDLARETQNLQLRVSPQVSEGVAIATGLLGGPIAALATFVAQKLLKDPFGDLVSFRYSVTGSWADPTVTRLDQALNTPPPTD